MTILITGSHGLVGAALSRRLTPAFQVEGFDLRNGPDQDIRNDVPINGHEGIVHLAAVSRVVTGEHDPQNCVRTNVEALRMLYANAARQARPPWIVFVSSREVYGSTGTLPVDEDTPFAPKNVYARSKMEGEKLSLAARDAGLIVNIARLSSVYGSVADHADRVAPCFARTAATGGTIQVEGGDHVFDFTHIDDVADGLRALVLETHRRHLLPAVHFVSGRGTSLGEFAGLAAGLARAKLTIVEAPPRPYGVDGFVGDPRRARELLGWTSTISLEQGMADFVDAFAFAAATT